MDLIEAIFLGIVQGLTEFLPVSSSGHLELTKYIFGSQVTQDESLLMTVVLHFATASSTIVIFRKEIAEIFKGLFQFKWNEGTQFSVKIILSMIPAALVGLLLEKELKTLFDGQILFVGIMLLFTGALLFLADRAKKTDKSVSFFHAILIGVSQAIAILPGISRSGATISTSVLLGIDRERAARFSFLMVIPLIFGKMAKDVKDMAENPESAANIDFLALGVGFIFAFFTGLIACKWMISLVKKSKLTYFGIYCFLVGIAAVCFALLYI